MGVTIVLMSSSKGVVKERSVRVIIDGGSCNNLAIMEMVEKLSLTTRPHPHPYYIQLNYQVLSFLGNNYNVHENMMLPKLDTFVLFTNEGPSLDKKDDN